MDAKDRDLSAFVKLPGFFPAAELADVLAVDGDTLISCTGTLADGTPVYEVYRRARPYRLEEDFAGELAAPAGAGDVG